MPMVAPRRAHFELACCLPPAAGVRGQGSRGQGRDKAAAARAPSPWARPAPVRGRTQPHRDQDARSCQRPPAATRPHPQRRGAPRGSAASGDPGVSPSLLLSPVSLPPPSSSAFPCRSLVSSPRPGPGHAPVHFRLLLWPPRFLQDEEEEGGSSQAAGNSGVSGTRGPSSAPAPG